MSKQEKLDFRNNQNIKNNFFSYILLYVALILYSFSIVFSKLATKQDFLSLNYILYLAIVIFILAIYAILWQQILKKIDLSVAMANKPIAIVLCILWAVLFFDEKLNTKTILGVIFVFLGVIIVVSENICPTKKSKQ